MQGIYKIENLINGKCYIGQSIDIEKRWTRHRSTANNPNERLFERHLYRSIRKYGIENFRFSVLEEVELEDDLTNRELYWYSELDPEYNKSIPGQMPTQRYTRAVLAGKMTGINTSNIIQVCKGNRETAGGYIWKYKEEVK